ncbi:DUF1145 domain-containing protein [Shewanella intestini]|uniref:DUF1145 domain-containing protein n=1 Tax=Shewanella intestini TaxID=2017544 RepID=A0ABS5I3Z9_9GAMM|nr:MULTISPECIES: DUF1145 domain-containing protein [Shewanella]MBR9728747.1 DUF1145 domain-containing protein [Shewanella intestini]MRG36823.1 DUF1145 domain-containing protein [Shewanella sp. XMDDZSB0408]
MNKFVLFGKILTAAMWVLMTYNLLMPFESKASVLLNFFMLFTAIMHLIQVAMFHTIFAKTMVLKATDYLQAFIFGAFTLMQYRQKLISQMADN